MQSNYDFLNTNKNFFAGLKSTGKEFLNLCSEGRIGPVLNFRPTEE